MAQQQRTVNKAAKENVPVRMTEDSTPPPHKILKTEMDCRGERYFMVQWADHLKTIDIVPAKEAKARWPAVVFEYYEKELDWYKRANFRKMTGEEEMDSDSDNVPDPEVNKGEIGKSVRMEGQGQEDENGNVHGEIDNEEEEEIGNEQGEEIDIKHHLPSSD